MENPLIPMLAITGKPNRINIEIMIGDMTSVGIEQFLIYPRDGCEIEYLSEEWFDMCENFVSAASDAGMKIWLYDDFNWPSGNCKGKIMKLSEDYCLKAMKINDGKISIFVDKAFPDILNPLAVDSFITLTHKEYEKRFKKYFGTVIIGIFTDEPSFCYASKEGLLPYYEGIKEDYLLYSGIELENDMDSKNFLTNIYHLLSERMEKVYIGKLRGWCDNNGLVLTGHLLNDTMPHKALKANGDILKVLQGLSIPGIDEMYTRVNHPDNSSSFAIAEYCAKKSLCGVMSEMFSMGPCDMKYDTVRQMIWYASLHGISLYFLAIMHVDARGNYIKRQWLSDFSTMQPCYSGMKALGEDVKKAAVNTFKIKNNEFFVLYPQALSANLLCDKENSIKVDKNLSVLINMLNTLQLQWEYVSETDMCDEHKLFMIDNNFVTFDGKKFADPTDAARYAYDTSKQKLEIKDDDGELANNIILRVYEDNSFVVLDTQQYGGEKRTLFACEGNIKKAFELYPCDVYTSWSKHFSTRENIEFDISEYNVEYFNSNCIRVIFESDNQRYEIKVEEDFIDVMLHIRNYPSKGMVLVDGEHIEFDNECEDLPDGLKQLYSSADKIRLTKGKHEFRLLSGEAERQYLPVMFISGDFWETDGVLKRRKSKIRSGEFIEDFGIVELSQSVYIPNGSGEMYLEVFPVHNTTQLIINDEALPEIAWYPYRWKVMDSCKGQKVTLKFSCKTSIAPVFGNVRRVAKLLDDENHWASVFYPQKNVIGFRKDIVLLSGEFI